MARRYVPDRGDLVWLDFTPQAGHEQAGRRPALVLSPRAYNDKSGLMLACPIANQAKGYPFEVALPTVAKATGVVLADQVRNLDWHDRRATRIAAAPESLVKDVLAKLHTLLS
jgi:mRNA interferase MazF